MLITSPSKIVSYAEKKNKDLDELTILEIKKIYKDLDKNVLKYLM